jgi:hypothetical protein
VRTLSEALRSSREAEEGKIMPDNRAEDPPGREGKNYDETMSEDLLDEEDLDPEEAGRRITQFVTAADELPGPPVAERVTALIRAASRDLETIMDGVAHNKVIATQLLLGQRARGRQPHDPKQWNLYAASTLLSGIVVRGAES